MDERTLNERERVDEMSKREKLIKCIGFIIYISAIVFGVRALYSRYGKEFFDLSNFKGIMHELFIMNAFIYGGMLWQKIVGWLLSLDFEHRRQSTKKITSKSRVKKESILRRDKDQIIAMICIVLSFVVCLYIAKLSNDKVFITYSDDSPFEVLYTRLGPVVVAMGGIISAIIWSVYCRRKLYIWLSPLISAIVSVVIGFAYIFIVVLMVILVIKGLCDILAPSDSEQTVEETGRRIAALIASQDPESISFGEFDDESGEDYDEY